MQTENINNIAEEERRKFSLQLDREMEIEEIQILRPESEEVKYEKRESQNEIADKKDYIKDF